MDTQKTQRFTRLFNFQSPAASFHTLRNFVTEPTTLNDRLGRAIAGLNQLAADEGLTTAFTDGGDIITDFRDEDLAAEYEVTRHRLHTLQAEREQLGRNARKGAIGAAIAGGAVWVFTRRTTAGRNLARRIRRRLATTTHKAKRVLANTNDNQAAALLQELTLGGNPVTVVPLTDEATAWHGTIAVDKTGFTLYSESGETIRFRAEAVLNVNITVDDDGPAEALVTVSSWKTVEADGVAGE